MHFNEFYIFCFKNRLSNDETYSKILYLKSFPLFPKQVHARRLDKKRKEFFLGVFFVVTVVRTRVFP